MANEYELTREELLARSRQRPNVEARWLLIMRLRDELGLSYSAIGQFIGLDHTTVMHGYKRARELFAPIPAT